MRRSLILSLLAPLAAVALVGACGGDDGATTEEGDIEIIDPWARIARDDLGAAYFTIVNGTDDTVRLTGASTPVAERVEIHETTMGADGQMSMAEVEGGFEIPAGDELVLEPGGKHLMMMGFAPGDADSIELRLDFDGTEVVVQARIDREASAMTDGHMGDDMNGDMNDDMNGDEPMGDGMESDDTMAPTTEPEVDPAEQQAAEEEAAAAAEEARLEALVAGATWDDGDLESILDALDIEALHALDVDLNAGLLDVEAQLPVAERALVILQRAAWPIDVDPAELELALDTLVSALRSQDLETAAWAAKAVHDVSHDLEPAGHSH